MRPLDAYHGNFHLFWPRLYSVSGRHSRRGLLVDNPTTTLPMPFGAPASPSSGSVSTAANAVEHRPSDIGAGALPDTFASVYEVLDRIAEGRES